MNKHLLNLLVCPSCQGELFYYKEAAELICRFDRIAYPIQDNIPIMFPEKARRLALEEYEQLFK